MKKYLVGSMAIVDEEKIYTDDFKTFYNENDEPLSDDDLNQWAVFANSPWSQAHEKYEIKCNCKNAYTEMKKGDFIWRCEYSIVGYEMLTASVIGYGMTEIEALNDCINRFKEIQEKYNAEDECF